MNNQKARTISARLPAEVTKRSQHRHWPTRG
jgi:hypothetical protein